MNTMVQFLCSDPAMYMSPGHTYARVGVRDPARTYTYVAVFSFLHTGCFMYVYMLRACLYYDMCTPLHPPVYMYVHVRDQNDNATYASTRWVPPVRHFLAYEYVAGGPSSQGANCSFFARTHFLACEGVAGWSQYSGGKCFFVKYGGPSGGSLLLGGGIIIFRVIRRHFLATAVDPAVSLSTYNPRPMEVVP